MSAKALPNFSVARLEPLILVQEISHRVVNEYTQAIATIRLAAARMTSVEGRDVLTTTASRLRSYAEAHRALQAPVPHGCADLGDYLRKLCSAVSVAHLRERGVRLTLRADAISLPADRCWRVALIVSELITNSVRHGLRNGPGRILVELREGDATNSCRVKDDGRPSSIAKPGRGITVVQGLAVELGGYVAWACDDDGTSAELIFPSAAVEA